MSEIFDQSAYNTGAEKAKELIELVKKLIASLPAGFRAEIRGEQLYLYAPHEVTTNLGSWGQSRDYKASYISLTNISQSEWDAAMKDLAFKIANKESDTGFKEQFVIEIKPLQVIEEKPTEQPKPIEPEKPKLSGQELRLRGLETEIAEEIKAAELSKELGLSEQTEAHETTLKHLKRIAEVIKKGYERIHWNEDEYNSKKFEEYKPPIPARVLESLKKAKQENLFDSFGIGIEADDPILIGRVKEGELVQQFKIDEW